MAEDGGEVRTLILIVLVSLACFMTGIWLIWILGKKLNKTQSDHNQEEMTDLVSDLECNVCHEKFQTSIEMLEHQKGNHFWCNKCQHAFKHQSYLNESKHGCIYRH